MAKEETAELKKKIEELEQKNAELNALLEISEKVKLNSHTGYFSYLFNFIRKNRVFSIFLKAGKIFTGFRLISRIFKVIGIIILALETGTAIFIGLILLAILLPPALIYLFAVFLYSLFTSPRDIKRIFDGVGDRKIIVIFPARRQNLGCHSFLYRNARDLEQKGYFVISVSPFWLSSVDISGNRKLYANQKITNGIVTVRRQYFFRIKKQLLKNHNQRAIFIH